MGDTAHLSAVKDRNGGFSGYYKCSLCAAEFRPNPKNLGEMSGFFAAHVQSEHPADKTTHEGTTKTIRDTSRDRGKYGG